MRWIVLLLVASVVHAAPIGEVRVALVLGGGGARGLAHIGVLEELEKAGVVVDLVVGCSAGSIVGALYADCNDASLVHLRFDRLKRRDLVDVNLLRGWRGLASGKALCRFLRKNLQVKNIEDLRIPLLVVATDLQSGERVVFDKGPITPAVQASSAYPFVFQPVAYEGKMLVDGGVVEPIPVSLAKYYSPQLIIAVDVGLPLADAPPSNLFGVMQRSVEITYARQSQSCVRDADVVIQPDLGDMGLFDEDHNQFAYEQGREATRAVLPEIFKRLQQ
jgi:NTE family protein